MNRQFCKLFALALLLTCAGCSTTEKQPAAATKVDADGLPILTEDQKEAGIICVREPVTGSRISKKTCTTKEQRERNQRVAEQELRNTQLRSAGPTISE